jgi:hypothetical protein
MPISSKLGIIPNLGDLFVRRGALVTPSGQSLAGNDICHYKRMMFSTGGLQSIPR